MRTSGCVHEFCANFLYPWNTSYVLFTVGRGRKVNVTSNTVLLLLLYVYAAGQLVESHRNGVFCVCVHYYVLRSIRVDLLLGSYLALSFDLVGKAYGTT